MSIIKRAFQEAKKTPGFSLLYVCGVAFTIAFTLVYGFILYGQLGPIYPEYDRESTYYLEQIIFKHSNYTSIQGIGDPFIDQFLRDSLKSVEKLTVIAQYNPGYPMVQTNRKGSEFHVERRMTEPSFFDFYKYEFIAGRPFSQDEFDAGDQVAVISDKVANRLYQNPENAIDKKISIDHSKYRITGVFREGSALNVDSYGEVFIPYDMTTLNGREWHEKYGGTLKVIFKVKNGKEDLLRKELDEISQRINSVDTTAAKFIIPYVPSHAEHILADKYQYSHDQDNYQVAAKSPWKLSKPYLIGLFVILIIPALNITGLIGARMDRIRADIGIRRCFGATRKRLIWMVLSDNLILTLAGGILGLLVAWIIAIFAGDILLQFMPLGYDKGMSYGGNAPIVTDEMAFAPVLFLLTLLICVILNLLSAWIPTQKAINSQITNSLNSKR